MDQKQELARLAARWSLPVSEDEDALVVLLARIMKAIEDQGMSAANAAYQHLSDHHSNGSGGSCW